MNKSLNNVSPSIKKVQIGLLHSLSGNLAISEKPLLDAENLAIDQINASGGVLGYMVEPIIMDGASSTLIFAQKARELIESGIHTLFGCWTSASRKAVKPIIEDVNGLLWYPVHYEGFEESKSICYTGSCLNQQIIPALEWALKQFGTRVFLLGSDYIFPHASNFLIRSFIEEMNGLVVHESYASLDCSDFSSIIKIIDSKKPDFIFNTLNGISNVSFYKQLHIAGISADNIPVVASSVNETEMAEVASIALGHYTCHSYFQSINSNQNKEFITRYKAHYGQDSLITAPMISSWAQIHLWKIAVEKAESFKSADIKQKLKGLALNSPTGKMVIEKNFHVRKTMRIGKLNAEGQFDIVWESRKPIEPLPWLGLENLKFPTKNLIIKSLSAFSDNINYNIRLEKEITERIRAEQIAAENAVIVENKVIELNEEIEHRKYIERALNRFTTAVEQAPLSIVITDLTGKIEYVNPKFCEITGYSFKEVLNNNPSILKSGKTPEETYQIMWKTINSGEIWQGEFINKKKNTGLYHEEAVIAPIIDESGNIINFIALKTDITDRKVAETKLKNSEIELKELNATKDKLFSVIAHDLKSPFATIIGLSEMLSNRYKESDNKDAKELIENINMVSRTSFKMLENLLSWAKNQTNQINIFLEPLNLSTLIIDVIAFTRTIAKKKNISIEFEPVKKIEVTTDSDMFRIILGNLISNSIKYTKDGGKITVNISLKDTLAIISVSDNGIGMDPKTKDALFKSSVNVSAYGTNSEKGTGLGLVVCKEFVNKLGGSIWAESALEKGSTFYFTVPLYKIVY